MKSAAQGERRAPSSLGSDAADESFFLGLLSMFVGCGRYYPQPAGFHFVAIPLFLRGIREPAGFPGLRRWLCRSSSAYTNSPSSLQTVVFLLVLPFILADGGHFFILFWGQN